MASVTVEQAERIVEVAEEYGYYGYEVRESYSGRGMYGEGTVAITGGRDADDESGIFVAIGVLLGSGELEDDASACNWFQRSDSMGLGWVRY